MNTLITLLAPIIWGSTYLVTTELLPADSPLLASVLRALPAGLILLAIGKKLPVGTWWLKAFILGTLNIAAFFYFLFVAAYHLPGGIAALVMSFQPMIVLILSAFLLKETVKQHQILACFLGAFGIALLVLQPEAQLDITGVIAGLSGAICMAVGIVLTKRWGRPQGVSILNFTGWQLTAGGLLLLPVALLSEDLPNTLTGLNVIGFTYLSILGALVAYTLWFKGIEKMPASRVAFLGFASPLSATLLGYLVLGESLSTLQLLGGFIIIISIALAQLKSIRSTHHRPQPNTTA